MGLTTHELMGRSGHKSLAMVEEYTKAAEQKKLADSAAKKMSKAKLQRRNGGCCDMGPASCTRDETEAKNQLAKRWSSYGASEKKECVGESTTGGEKSYVELLTCLEMSTG